MTVIEKLKAGAAAAALAPFPIDLKITQLGVIVTGTRNSKQFGTTVNWPQIDFGTDSVLVEAVNTVVLMADRT